MVLSLLTTQGLATEPPATELHEDDPQPTERSNPNATQDTRKQDTREVAQINEPVLGSVQDYDFHLEHNSTHSNVETFKSRVLGVLPRGSVFHEKIISRGRIQFYMKAPLDPEQVEQVLYQTNAKSQILTDIKVDGHEIQARLK